jgi:glycerol-3-phosphate acyltransferase PlsY
VQRYLGNTAGALTLLLDASKGAVAVWVAADIGLDRYWVAAVAVLVVVGHSYPVFLRFRGGKGVATGAGAFGVLTPGAVLGAVGVFLLLTATGRMVSLGSVAAALSLPLFAGLWYDRPALAAAAIVSLLVLFRHRENIRNLVKKRERRLSREPDDPDSGIDAKD